MLLVILLILSVPLVIISKWWHVPALRCICRVVDLFTLRSASGGQKESYIIDKSLAINMVKYKAIAKYIAITMSKQQGRVIHNAYDLSVAGRG